MDNTSHDAGLIQVLAERLKTQHLPRTLAIKEKVDQGDTLDEFDIHFLEELFQDAREVMPLVDRHPEWQDLVARIFHLYKEITDTALKNEQSPGHNN